MTQSINQITRILAKQRFLAKRDEIIKQAKRKAKERIYSETFSDVLEREKEIVTLHNC